MRWGAATMTTWVVAGAVAVGGCTFSGSEAPAESGLGSDDGVSDADADDGTGPGTSSGTSSGTSGDDTTTGPAPTGPYPDCAALLASNPAAPNGVYDFETPSGNPFKAFCNMVTDDGGWTLVGRSVPMDPNPVPFGWRTSRGSLDDDLQPYGLNAATNELDFNEVLIASHGGAKVPAGDAFVVEVPSGFLEIYRDGAFQTPTIRTVLGSCEPAGGPTMMAFIGFTGDGQRFFFSDSQVAGEFGLDAHGFDLVDVPCPLSGNLHGRNGVIYVR